MPRELNNYLNRNRGGLRPGMRPEVEDYLQSKYNPTFEGPSIDPSSFDVSGSASTATVPGLPPPDNDIPPLPDYSAQMQRVKDNPSGVQLESPFKYGTRDDLNFRMPKGGTAPLNFQPGKPEVPAPAAPPTPAPAPPPEPIEPEIAEAPEPIEPEKSAFELQLEQMRAQLTRDVQRSDKAKIPQLIASAFTGLGDALVRQSGRQAPGYLKSTLSGREKALGRLDKRAEALMTGERGLEAAKSARDIGAAETEEEARRWEAEMGLKEREVSLKEREPVVKAPTDHRYLEDGTLEVIPGSETDREIKEIERAGAAGRENAMAQAQHMIGKADLAIEQVGMGITTTGESGRFASKLPFVRQARIDLENTISTLKANQAFQTLQKMREASKTGGALGQVSEKELKLLEDALTSLNINQSDAQLKRNLAEVKAHWTKALWALNEIDRRGGDVPLGSLEEGDIMGGGGMGSAEDPLGVLGG